MPDAYDYVPSGNQNAADPTSSTLLHGAGNNPSTWAGLFVIVAVMGLGGIRKTFRRFM